MYEKNINVAKTLADTITHYILRGGQTEDEDILYNVPFADGTEMDVHCRGAKGITSWTEAILTRNGDAIASSGPDKNFFKTWELADPCGKMYRVTTAIG